jgi:signal transduction histidine kinase
VLHDYDLERALHSVDHQVKGVNKAPIEVRGHGTSVPINELTNIFKPFYRVAEAQGSDPTGAGLGLAITERIVTLHEGRIARPMSQVVDCGLN